VDQETDYSQLGLTAPEVSREAHFRDIVSLGDSGLEAADDLVRQAAKRLDIILGSPAEPFTPTTNTLEREIDGYPFPPRTSRARRKSKHCHSRDPSGLLIRPTHHRHPSSASGTSILSILPTPIKTSPSSVSLATEPWSPTHLDASSPIHETAVDTLKRVQARSHVDLRSIPAQPACPSIRHWSLSRVVPDVRNIFATPPDPPARSSPPAEPEMATLRRLDDTLAPLLSESTSPIPSASHPPPSPPSATAPPRTPVIRPSASSPALTNHRRDLHSTPLRPQQSSANLLISQPEIAAIDPSLAAAEMSSTLTRHASCSVCEAKGVNLPECRRCGMRFCSRGCRVGEKGAGDGKRWVDIRLSSIVCMGDRADGRIVGIGMYVECGNREDSWSRRNGRPGE